MKYMYLFIEDCLMSELMCHQKSKCISHLKRGHTKSLKLNQFLILFQISFEIKYRHITHESGRLQEPSDC